MKFVSTRGRSPAASLSEALRNGAAPDGGLYMPETLPSAEISARSARAAGRVRGALLAPFFEGDALGAASAGDLRARRSTFRCRSSCPMPPSRSSTRSSCSTGPTGAFKDFGARFLMACFDRLARERPADRPRRHIRRHRRRGRLRGRGPLVGARGHPLPARTRLAVPGTPAHLLGRQRPGARGRRRFRRLPAPGEGRLRRSGAVGRASADLGQFDQFRPAAAADGLCRACRAAGPCRTTGERPGFVVPSGNLGQGFAVLLAKAMGLPVGPVVLATNANRTLKDWHDTAAMSPAPSIETLANAMDVGNPSNFERVAALRDRGQATCRSNSSPTSRFEPVSRRIYERAATSGVRIRRPRSRPGARLAGS